MVPVKDQLNIKTSSQETYSSSIKDITKEFKEYNGSRLTYEHSYASALDLDSSKIQSTAYRHSEDVNQSYQVNDHTNALKNGANQKLKLQQNQYPMPERHSDDGSFYANSSKIESNPSIISDVKNYEYNNAENKDSKMFDLIDDAK